MEERFGNVTLGEIIEMLVSFISKDMYLSFVDKVKDNTYSKYLNRLFKEEDSDLSALSLTDDKSIAKFVLDTILPYLQNEYSLSNNLCDFTKNFVNSLYKRFVTNETPILDYCLNFDSFDIQDYLKQAKQKYTTAFENIGNKYQSLKKFRECFDNEDTIKNIINSMKSKGDNPTWFNMEQLLKHVQDDKQISSLLIDAYIMTNIYATLHDKKQTKSIVEVQYEATNCINLGIQYFFVDYGYKTFEQKGNDILKLIECSTPAFEFYCNWFRGYHCVAKGNLDDAKEYYKKAFAARRFAGCQIKCFLKQAFALTCYNDFNADKVRDSAESKKNSQSPLSIDAKKFWNYGYAAGIFEQKVEETHQITFHRVDNIFKYYGTKMFFDNTDFYKKLISEHPNSFYLPSDDEKTFCKEFDRLRHLTKTDINKRIRMCGEHPTKNLPIVVALFCVENCYSSGYNDLAKKFIGLITKWLTEFNNLDFTLCSDKGSTIACDAIQQYKILKFHHSDLNINEVKQIVLAIIKKSDEESLKKNSFKLKRCALQEAIESCDIEIVEAVCKKFNDIGTLRISADETSPVYYAIHRYVYLYRYKNGRELRPEEFGEEYMIWHNLDVPGLTTEDKKMQMQKLESNTELWEAAKKIYMWESYGKEEIWEDELNWIKEVCLCLIDHTQNQDEYKKKDQDMVFTSLLFAVESNNVHICRALIKKDANPHIKQPYTFIHRCIRWESWNVLAMYMEEFPERAKIDIISSKHNDLFFFLHNADKCKKDMDNDYFNRIIELFNKYIPKIK